jgi:hypothetical protein
MDGTTALKYIGDHDGHAVWLKVAECAEGLLSEVQESLVTSPTLN